MGTIPLIFYGAEMPIQVGYFRRRIDGRLDLMWFGEPLATIDDDSNRNQRAIDTIHLLYNGDIDNDD